MNLFTVPLLVLVSFISAWYFTRTSINLALKRGILDIPCERSSHSIPVPRGGGSAFVLVFLLTAAVFGALRLLHPPEILGLLMGLSVAVVGFADDCAHLSIRIRLLIQGAAAAAALVCLVDFHGLVQMLGSTSYGIAAILVGWVALIWSINLTNFMDGIDGLAGTEAVTVSAVCCAFVILSHGIDVVALLYAVLAGAAMGFLIWNWFPAKIFMGDVGSGFLGYCFAAMTLLAISRGVLSPVVPLLLLGVFIIDASLTLGKRFMRGEQWHQPHRSHAFQHCAQRFGHERTTLLVAAINLLWLTPWAAWAQWHPSDSLLCLAFAWAPLLVGVHLLRAGEATGLWKSADSDVQVQPARILAASTFGRTGASTLNRAYRITGKHGFAAKHLVLAILNFGCVYLAFWTRYDGVIPGRWLNAFPLLAFTWSLPQGAVLLLFRASRSHWRFTSVEEIPKMSAVAALASLTGAGAVYVLSQLIALPVPRSVYLLNVFYSVTVLAAMRLSSRFLFRLASRLAREEKRKRVFIYGADEAGVGVLSELRRHCHGYQAIGFLDDRPEIQGVSLSGLRVLGKEGELGRLAKKHRIQQILLPSHSSTQTKETNILRICIREQIDFRIVTTISEEIGLRQRKNTHEIVMEELLAREQVELDISCIASKIEDKVIMVTGAGGSIGSEICRQVARFRPKAILGYDLNETALFYMERQMRELFPEVAFCPCLGSVQNRTRLADVILEHRPSIVYHAAAYKHVPLMEQHLFEAIENNIFGTETLLRACEDFGVRTLVMISTDKAAHPTSLMGASKRIAEKIVRSSRSPNLTCVSTRFGNVLGSNGSVLPIFREQIANGGPVKITHPAMTRFFMTIPEAAQLVLQASSLGASNEIFVLDMGAPVKIVDLAERMIRLSGLVPGKDIAIEFTGIRPGEKIDEELTAVGEELIPTTHRKIFVFRSGDTSSNDLHLGIERLKEACEQRSASDALRMIERLVPDYTPSREIQELASAAFVQTPPIRRLTEPVLIEI